MYPTNTGNGSVYSIPVAIFILPGNMSLPMWDRNTMPHHRATTCFGSIIYAHPRFIMIVRACICLSCYFGNRVIRINARMGMIRDVFENRLLNAICYLGSSDKHIDCQAHDDVIKWKHFPHYWPFARGIHRSQVDSPHKGQWRALVFSSIFAWTNGWVNNQDAGDSRHHCAHYGVTVMQT